MVCNVCRLPCQCCCSAAAPATAAGQLVHFFGLRLRGRASPAMATSSAQRSRTLKRSIRAVFSNSLLLEFNARVSIASFPLCARISAPIESSIYEGLGQNFRLEFQKTARSDYPCADRQARARFHLKAVLSCTREMRAVGMVRLWHFNPTCFSFPKKSSHP